MSDANDRYMKPKPRSKTPPVRRVVVSDEARQAYEDIVRGRDERERAYGRHLADERKGKR